MMQRLRASSVGAGGWGGAPSTAGHKYLTQAEGGLLRIRTSILSELV